MTDEPVGDALIARFNTKTARWMRAYEFLRHRKRSYLIAEEYLRLKGFLLDLAVFCRASETTIAPTVEQTYALIGRREVWLRIQEHLNLSPEQLTDLYAGPDKDAR